MCPAAHKFKGQRILLTPKAFEGMSSSQNTKTTICLLHTDFYSQQRLPKIHTILVEAFKTMMNKLCSAFEVHSS